MATKISIVENSPWLNVRRVKGNTFRISIDESKRNVKLKMAPKIEVAGDGFSRKIGSSRTADSQDVAHAIEAILPTGFRATITGPRRAGGSSLLQIRRSQSSD